MTDDQNKNEYTDEELEILADLRKKRDKEGTLESYLYGLMQTAHPNMIQFVENQAIQMIMAGKVLGKELKEAEKDPVKNAQMSEALRNAAYGLSNTSPKKDEEDLDI